MGVFDKPFLALANTLITSLGGSCILKSVVKKYDALNGVEVKSQTQSYTISCSPPYPYTIDQIDGSAVRQGDFRIIISAEQLASVSAPTPDLHMTITRDGKEFSIVLINPLNAGDSNVAYELQLRGG